MVLSVFVLICHFLSEFVLICHFCNHLHVYKKKVDETANLPNKQTTIMIRNGYTRITNLRHKNSTTLGVSRWLFLSYPTPTSSESIRLIHRFSVRPDMPTISANSCFVIALYFSSCIITTILFFCNNVDSSHSFCLLLFVCLQSSDSFLQVPSFCKPLNQVCGKG